MTVTNQTMLDASALALGRNPRWVDESGDAIEAAAPQAAPTSTGSGFVTDGALVCMVAVDLHNSPAIPRAIVEVTSVNDSTAHTVDIDGQEASYTADGDATLAEVLAGLQSAVTTLAITGVTASVEDADGDGTDELVIHGSDRRHLVEAGDYTSVTMEASYAEFRVWALPYNSTRWRVIRPLPDQGLDVRTDGTIEARVNMVARVSTAGMQRIAVEFTDTDGTVSWRLGICEAE